MTVAALYVEKGGAYFGLPDVDPWDERSKDTGRRAVSRAEASATPAAFRDALLEIARAAQPSLDILPALVAQEQGSRLTAA